jgi:hypothetical protein
MSVDTSYAQAIPYADLRRHQSHPFRSECLHAVAFSSLGFQRSQICSFHHIRQVVNDVLSYGVIIAIIFLLEAGNIDK